MNTDWIKKHADTVAVIASLLGCVLWMNTKFNAIDDKFHAVDLKFSHVEKEIYFIKHEVDLRFSQIEKEIVIIKTVLLMQKILPSELVKQEEK
jgi:hypothetical protein